MPGSLPCPSVSRRHWPAVFDHARGSRLNTAAGTLYLDFFAGARRSEHAAARRVISPGRLVMPGVLMPHGTQQCQRATDAVQRLSQGLRLRYPPGCAVPRRAACLEPADIRSALGCGVLRLLGWA